MASTRSRMAAFRSASVKKVRCRNAARTQRWAIWTLTSDFGFVESHRMQVVWDRPQADSVSPIPFIRFVVPSTNW